MMTSLNDVITKIMTVQMTSKPK